LPISLLFFGLSIWWLLLWTRFASEWTNHYLDIWVVTNKRVIDIEQRSFFSRQVSNFRVERVQDITTDVHGFFHTMLNFGDVHVQTASENLEFIIRDAPNPSAIKQLLLRETDRAIEEYRKENTIHKSGASV
jgi:uncharacterized membrane protein YdbT with pleckstrin-like domain